MLIGADDAAAIIEDDLKQVFLRELSRWRGAGEDDLTAPP